ncbi:MAG: mRNA degradation ribonuclease J1/J2 [Candidatus Methanohalarchaeum thermophilum]|uniref:mRNA degradation ribonuclease J1/J2 n=1 Tax=Methanohalarchaeum thermophilum TaxID=1903181 RepID=A0A1Q6DWL7_METT1|nr:MAG: mRNA degradation ribonuclease J1/J2 [Candidatus Methanohalarchaeum thermophilum]
MASIKVYGGAGEIGGNKIHLKTEDTSLFLDFGRSFGGEKQYYDNPYLTPRDPEQLQELGLLPDISSLYKNDEEPEIDGVMITHPHLDHWGYCCYLDNDIPLYCGETTKDMILNYEYSGSCAPSKKYYIGNLTKSKGRKVYRDFQTFRTGDKIEFDDLSIEPIHVDHSIPGAYAYIIHTPKETIAYTGDYRLHGPRSDLTEDFIYRAKSAEIDTLITEATNIVGADTRTEKDVRKDLTQIIGETNGLVITNFNNRDIDRLRTAYKAAKINGRKLVISTKQAFLLQEITKDKHLDIFDITNDNILVFSKNRKRTQAWEQEIHEKTKTYNGKELNKIQEQTVLVASYYDMNEIMKINPQPGSTFISSQSEAFDEEGEIQHKRLLNWCEHMGLPQYQAHASGHIGPCQLKNTIKQIQPKKLIPVHTERPNQLKKYISNLKCKIKTPKQTKK